MSDRLSIVIATTNQHKLTEIKAILRAFPVTLQSLCDFPPIPHIEEAGTTYEANALLKATEVSKITQLPSLADDSGIEIEALNNEPGLHSSRYLGENTPYEIKNQTILERLKGLPKEKRGTRYVCAVALVFPDGRTYNASGTVEGVIAETMSGTNGFGYDPIFFLLDYGKTMAEISSEEKNKISHRANALKSLFGKIFP